MVVNENSLIKQLKDHKLSIWIDDLSREMIKNDELEYVIKNFYVSGLTTNPIIFYNSLSKNKELYIKQIKCLKNKKNSIDELTSKIMMHDVQRACDVFHSFKKRFDCITDGKVSIEVDPRFANNKYETIKHAKYLWKNIKFKNLYIKIPATDQGLMAISELIANGININVTLIFSLQRYKEVINAYMLGLEKAIEKGNKISSICSVASFFISRMDTLIDKLIDHSGDKESLLQLKGKAAIANAQLAYKIYSEMFSSQRWHALKKFGANNQIPLWASTSVKNKNYPKTMYISKLMFPNTINTIPKDTLFEIRNIKSISSNILNQSLNKHLIYENANDLFKKLSQFGISYNEVVEELEKEGIKKFVHSWNEILKQVNYLINN